MPARRHSAKPRTLTRAEHGAGRAEHKAAGAERLQKVLAAAGVGSRRDCETLILEGRVEVDGQIVQQLGTRVDPLTQRIRVDGTTLPAPRRVYYVLNKPPGILCTNNDPSGRARAIDLIRSDERLFTVGRLDQASEGLIILTNDGELANQLTHPRYGIEKIYRVRVAGTPDPAVLGKLKRGIHFADGFAKVSDVQVKTREKQSTILEIVLSEGRNREIRRLLARIGHKVLSLTRIAMGPLRLADLPSGAHRPMTRDEVKSLRRAVAAPGDPSSRPMARRSTSGRGKQTRTGKPTAKPHFRSSASSAAAPTRSVKKTRELPISDQPTPGAILGGDETAATKKKSAKTRAHSPSSRKSGARKPKSGQPSGRKLNRKKPAKKGRR